MRRLTQILAALLVMAAPAIATAHDKGLAERTVEGTPFDPRESSLWITPPQGGTVLVYQDGDTKGWFIHSGAITVTPHQVYGILATRGTSVIFHSALLVRPGVTSLSWNDGSRSPTLAFQPMFFPHRQGVHGHRPHPVAAGRHPAPARGASRAVPRRAAAKPAAPTAAKRRQLDDNVVAGLAIKLDRVRDDQGKMRMLEGYARRYSFTRMQSQRLVATFDGAQGRAAAERLLGVRATPRSRTTLNSRVALAR